MTRKSRPKPTKTIAQVKEKCFYCGINDPECIIMCFQCNKWYCNGSKGTDPLSHIVVHLLRSKHKEIDVHKDSTSPYDTLCSLCECTNVFVLGLVGKRVVCRLPSECAVKTNLNKSPLDWQPIIKEKSTIDEWIARVPTAQQLLSAKEVTIEDIIRLEKKSRKYNKRSNKDEEDVEVPENMTMFKDGQEYRNYFIALLKLEEVYSSFEDRIKVEILDTNRGQDNIIKASFKSGNNDEFYPLGADIRIKTSGTDNKWSSDGVVTSLPDGGNHEFGLEINARKDLPLDLMNNLEVDNFWTKVSYNRMKSAVRVFAEVSKSGQHSYINTILGLPIDGISGDEMVTDFVKQHFVVDLSIALETSLKISNSSNKVSHKSNGFTKLSKMERKQLNSQRIGPKVVANDEKFPINPTVKSAPNLSKVNSSQEKAIRHSIENSLSLIQGPPGTGKTVTAATLVYNLVTKYGEKVLVCAPSNTAVDNLTEKIYNTECGLKVVRVLAKSRERIWEKDRKDNPIQDIALHNIIRNMDPSFNLLHKKFLNGSLKSGSDMFKIYNQTKRRLERQAILDAQVVCCTCICAGDSRIKGVNYSTVLIDEASQASEPECMVPIVYFPKRIVLVGDHKQLRPVIKNQKAVRAGLERSLFERMASNLNIEPKLLNTQYRMHPSISQFPSDTFYESKLKDGVNAIQRSIKCGFPWPQSEQPICFICVKGYEEISDSGTSYLNRKEAAVVDEIVSEYFIKKRVSAEQIGIITPYKGQQRYLKQFMQFKGSFKKKDYENIEVASVNTFQGREKEFIIFSCVRSDDKIGFLSDERRMNVALTRARCGLVIIGNPTVLSTDKHWNQLLQYYKDKNALVEGPLNSLKPCVCPIGCP